MTIRAAERVARFRREAHILASLNHSNIAAIHGLEETEASRDGGEEPVIAELFAARFDTDPFNNDASHCDVLKDGSGFGIVRRVVDPDPSTERLNMVLNRTGELRDMRRR